MRRELTRIEPARAAHVVAIRYGILGVFFSMILLPSFALVPFRDQAGNVVDSRPLVTLIGGWISFFPMSHAYNLVARRVGGIRIEVAPSDSADSAA